jgi:hypothetical protein
MIAIATITNILFSSQTTAQADLLVQFSNGTNFSDQINFNMVSAGGAIAAAKNSVMAFQPSLKWSDITVLGAADSDLIIRKKSDQAFSTVNFADVTDLSVSLAASSQYKFRFSGAYIAAASGTGLQISVNGPASPSFIRFVGQIATSNIAVTYGAGAAYDVGINGTASGGATPLPFTLEGTIDTGIAGGIFTLRARSEVAASAVTILRGSVFELSVAG